MATQAGARAPQGIPAGFPRPKILRIGIVQGGRIVEERLVRKRENVSLGQSSKNMFVVPSDALPRQWLLFEQTPKGYVAHFADAMDARIAVGNEVISLAQLKQGGRIRKHGLAWAMLLDERSRGKISVGDVTVLFQFVTPPPPQPRPQLPPSVRGTLPATSTGSSPPSPRLRSSPTSRWSSTCAAWTGPGSRISRRSPTGSSRW